MINKSIGFILFALWGSVFLLVSDISQIHYALGGIFPVYTILMPINIAAIIISKKYMKYLLLLLLFLSSLVLVNIVYIWLNKNVDDEIYFLNYYISSFTIALIMISYVVSIEALFLLKNKQSKEYLSFVNVLLKSFLTPVGISYVLFFFIINSGNGTYAKMIELALGGVLFGSVMFLVLFKNLSMYSLLNRDIALVNSETVSLHKPTKLTIAVFLLFLTMSFSNEFTYRKQFMVWLETMSIFMMYIFTFFVFLKRCRCSTPQNSGDS